MQKIAVIATKNSALSMFRPVVQLSKKDMVGSMISVIDITSIVFLCVSIDNSSIKYPRRSGDLFER